MQCQSCFMIDYKLQFGNQLSNLFITFGPFSKFDVYFFGTLTRNVCVPIIDRLATPVDPFKCLTTAL